jgi:hypothetical protein
MRIFNRVQPVHKPVTGFGANSPGSCPRKAVECGIRGVFSGNLRVLYRFHPAVWNCAYLANAASGKDFRQITGKTSSARSGAAQPRVHVAIILFC